MTRNNDAFQRYLDAGIAFSNMTRRRAEELVHELVQSGDLQHGDARAKVDELIERSRKGSEAFVAQVRAEVTRQLEHVGITSLEDLAVQVATLLGRSAEAGRSTVSKKSPPKKATVTKKAPTKKKTAATKKAPTRTAAKKAPAMKKAAAAKKSPAAKKTPGKTAAKKTPGKTAAKKTPGKTAAKKAPATKSARTEGTPHRTGSAG